MDIGIGLPVTVPGTAAANLAGWARRAEDDGFASVAALDRIAYPNDDPLIALAAAAALTSTVRLATTVLLGPARGNGAVLAKQLMTVHRLSGGRLVVGLAVGARPGDYAAAGEPFDTRGRRLEALVPRLREAFAGRTGTAPGRPQPADHRATGPADESADESAVDGPPLLLGGHSDPAVARAARLADGWISGGSSGQPYALRADRARKAWAAAGRTSEPRLIALQYYSLGPGATGAAAATLGAFYAGTGPYRERAIAEALCTPEAIAAAVAEHADAGCHELVFMPCAGGPDQVHRLRDALP
jgi:alkanesulfonate monooxygenase SsuD/methylene tetrahydromethanopterin reductase-like flavin-dependent oxidoreductase (luciferase family)